MPVLPCPLPLGLVCYRSHIQLRGQILLRVFQWCPILQIVVLGCCTPVDNGVVLGAGRLVGGHVERSGGSLAPARCGLLSSSPFGWWCLVVVDGVDLCLRQAAEEMRLFVLRAHWLIPSSSWRASPCVMWWYWQWYWLYCCWTSHSSWSRQNDYSVRTPLVQMWQFPKLGVVGMPLGYGGVDWSTSDLRWACVPSLRDCVGIVLFVRWSQACWWGVTVSCTDFWLELRSLEGKNVFCTHTP